MSEEQRPATNHLKEVTLSERAVDGNGEVTVRTYDIDPEKVVECVRAFIDEMGRYGALGKGRHHYLKLCFSVSNGCWTGRGFDQE